MSSNIKDIELLAPARTADIGIEAINCGADAVYIGAAKFGARHAAGNSVADIARLTDYAHRYGAKVYVAINTIIFDNELEQVHRLALELHSIGVDALIVQDMALLEMELPLPLHASTQMDIRSAEKVRQLHSWGFKQVILARELGLKDIAHIHRECLEMKLEAFVHGALCVSYSGRCYASQYCFGRSANRGECAQFCRLAFDLEDDKGNVLVRNKHLLSLKDMNRTHFVEKMLDAGVCSLKIEGRLKDAAYVKNVTAFYSRLLDKIIKRRPQEFRRSAHGHCNIDFEPNLDKTFNRGFTDYFLNGRTEDVVSIHTPKAMGEYVGKVKEIRGNYVLISGTATFHNGDGLCFFDAKGELQGFRVNRVDKNKVFPHQMPQQLTEKTSLYRNHDAAFETAMLRPTPMRTIDVNISITDTVDGFQLDITDECGRTASINVNSEHQEARTPQFNRIANELSKVGGTGLQVTKIENNLSKDFFIPASQLSQWRRALIERLQSEQCGNKSQIQDNNNNPNCEKAQKHLEFTENIANHKARQFYNKNGVSDIEPAFELKTPSGSVALMTCRHCIKYSLGMCRKGARKLYLRLPVAPLGGAGASRDLPYGKKFPLEFDCKKCEMRVLKNN